MGGGGGDDKIPEPNLTAMLDLVLQMVMFFMVVANFVTQQLNMEIQLPSATTTLPIDQEETVILLLNIDKEGKLILSPKEQEKFQLANEVFNSPAKIEEVITRIAKDPGYIKRTVVIRAHNTATFEHVYRVMKAVKDRGFSNVQLRAKIQKV